MGTINYDRRKFFWANLAASVIWPLTIITLGYLLGRMFPNLIKFAEMGMILVLVLLGIPVLLEFVKIKKH
jgi:membrane protein DedA with SNARE-associated domain